MDKLINIATEAKALKRFTADTVKMLGKLDMRKHQNAVMAVYHAAQFGECYALNVFNEALKVNDQTALKAWIVENFSNTEGEVWLSFTTKKAADGKTIGYRVLKETQDVRKDRYDFDQLLTLEPFYNTDVSKPKVYDLNALLDMIVKAADNVTKKANKEKIALPLAFVSAMDEAKRIAILHHVDEAAQVAASANDNPPVEEENKQAVVND